MYVHVILLSGLTHCTLVYQTSFFPALVCNRALQHHLRYDNQLISQQSPFPRGSFVCKILTLNWHVDIIKLMKCNCNEQVRQSICSGTLKRRRPFPPDMLMWKAALCLRFPWVSHGNVKRCIFKTVLSEGAGCRVRGMGVKEKRKKRGSVWTWPNANSETDYIASRAVMIWQFICEESSGSEV